MTKPRWTEHHDSILRFEWGAPVVELAAKLGRTVVAIRWRARQLGLHLGKAPGHEYMTEAAKRTGYSVAQLRRILYASHVRIYTSPMAAHTHTVDSDDVNRAVEAWCSSEPLLMAARRHGVRPVTIRRALLKSGLQIPTKPAFRRHWRIPSRTIDEAMAMRANSHRPPITPPSGFGLLVTACAMWACSRTLLDYEDLRDRSELAVRTRWMIWIALLGAGVRSAVIAREFDTSDQMIRWAKDYAKLSDYRVAMSFGESLRGQP